MMAGYEIGIGSGRTRFVIESEEVASMVTQSGGTVLDLLPSLMKTAKTLARPPISKYNVGAVGLSSDGRIFLGVNLEFPGLPLHHSVHAEQFLVTNAGLHGATALDYIAVSSMPCGHCRQFLQEIRRASKIKILVQNQQGKEEETLTYLPLSEILPHPFGPHDLLPGDAPLLLEPHHNGLLFPHRNGCVGPDEDLRRASFDAANRSHAPYTGSPSGVALIDTRGRLFAGSYAESAAFNPSLGPVQAAIVAYVANGGGAYEEIVAATLAEKEGAVVVQETTARMLIQAVSPNCDFRAFRCSTTSTTKTHSHSD